ncbi:hypothetical protein [Alloacidobacterium sp.]|uniref:hypothetical protein n=1 Tax=Alloacidobacterium sp. TaxID=2951999 RepID=UPI002D51B399|nr:hypothetical protein [Alloacidobacterium sp.]HYK34401.1 hypothetical protein [Alloacidobacterium sp.]
MNSCTDQVVGDILSSWRYDISGISPEMRTDYEQHFVECQHCRSRQRLHRTIDVTLIGVATASMIAFVLALAVIHHLEPLRNWAIMNLRLHRIDVVLTLQAAAVVGLLVSALAWVLVAIATPAPVYITGVALAQARELQNRLPRKAA